MGKKKDKKSKQKAWEDDEVSIEWRKRLLLPS